MHSDTTPAPRRLRAKFDGRCSCGERVMPGAEILWRPGGICGCRACAFSGEHPNNHDGDEWDDLFSVFHE